MIWIAMFVSHSRGEQTTTPICTAAAPQDAIKAAKAALTGAEFNAWEEVPDEGLGRKILIREIRLSKAKEPVFEYGWVYAITVPTADGTLTQTDVALDEEAELR